MSLTYARSDVNAYVLQLVSVRDDRKHMRHALAAHMCHALAVHMYHTLAAHMHYALTAHMCDARTGYNYVFRRGNARRRDSGLQDPSKESPLPPLL